MHLTCEKIIVSGIFALQSITYLKITAKPNAHSELYLKGTIDKSMGMAILKERIYGTKIQISSPEATADALPIYTGIVQSAAITEQSGWHQIEINALSGSCLLDEKRQSRSFQEAQMTYKDVVETMLREVPHAKVFFSRGERQKIGRPLIQYKETDWAFIKRLASHFQAALIPDAISGNPAFWFGMRKGKARVVFSEEAYSFQADAKFYALGGEKAGYRRRDFCYYQVEDRNNYQLGDQTFFQKKELVITEKEAEFKNGELLFRYKLGRESSADERIYFNDLFTGRSLGGVVTDTDKEHVYLRLDIDFARGAFSYPYRWAPASGNLMYCMPEKGTRVVLYCKGNDERNAVATNGQEILGAFGHVRSDYNKKSFTTANKKNMYLHPGGMGFIGMSKEKSPLQIRVFDQLGIAFESHKTMKLLAQGQVRIEAPDVVFHAPKAMQFLQTAVYGSAQQLNVVPVGTAFWNRQENTTPLAELRQALKKYRDEDLSFLQEVATFFNNSSDEAVDVIFKYDEVITKAAAGVNLRKEMIQAILFRELIFYNVLDATDTTRVRLGIHKQASVGLGQIFPETASAAEAAYAKAVYGGETEYYSVEELFERLQDDQTNIYYVAMVLWHKADKLNVDVGGANPLADSVKMTFAAYNGFGSAARKYGEETFRYYKAFKEYSANQGGESV